MIRKTLIMASVFVFATSVMCFADTNIQTEQKPVPQVKAGQPYCKMPPPKGPDFKKRNAEFEKRLNLTDKQKQKAEELHKKGFEQMKPIMEDLKAKQKEAFSLKDATDEQSVQKREQLKKEIGLLKQQSHELRKQNMKDFESILTKKQKKELNKIKEEGRKNFEKNMKKHPHPEFGPGRCPGHAEIPPQPPVNKEVK